MPERRRPPRRPSRGCRYRRPRRAAAVAAPSTAAGAHARDIPARSPRSAAADRGNAARPASCSGLRRPESSISASGFPRALSTSRSRASPRKRRSYALGEQRPGRLDPEHAKPELRQTLSLELPHLTVARREEQHHPLRLEPPRRERERVGRRPMSHCASSTTQKSGSSSAASARRPRTATPIRKRSSTEARDRPSAPASAAACGSARCTARSRIGWTSWCRPANASSDSASIPPARSTRIPVACPSACPSSADLPTPGSPRTTSVPLREDPAQAMRRSTAANSASLPKSTGRS